MNQRKLQQSLTLGEGSRLFAYDDATGLPLKPGDVLRGNLTIGIGHNLTAKGISPAVQAELLDEDISEAMTALATLWPEWSQIDDVRQNAFLELAFNLEHRLEGFHKAISAAQSHDWPTCGAEFRASQWYRQVGARAVRIVFMLETGQWPPELA